MGNIDNINILYQFVDDKKEIIYDEKVNETFEQIVKYISDGLKKKNIAPTFQNVFTKENILKMESLLKNNFPDKNINLTNLIRGGFRMKELDELVFEAFDKKMKPIKDDFDKKMKSLQDSNQELVNYYQGLQKTNQELVNSNQELVKQLETLKGKKTISFEVFKRIKKENPGISDEEAFAIAKKQSDDSIDFL